MFSQLVTSMTFQTYPSMNHQINYLPYSLQEKSHLSIILECLVINMKSCDIRNLETYLEFVSWWQECI